MRLLRHDLVDLTPEAWRVALTTMPLPAAAAAGAAQWVVRGLPAIVRRRFSGDPPGTVPLAIQLPSALGRLRLAFALPPAAVVPRAPVTLADAAPAAPSSWAGAIGGVLALAGEFGTPNVYGSLLWQHLTGEPMLRESSDLDLLWQPPAHRREALVAALARLACHPRLDGEIVLEDGAGVSWRELQIAIHDRLASVAVKTCDGIALRAVGLVLCNEAAPC